MSLFFFFEREFKFQQLICIILANFNFNSAKVWVKIVGCIVDGELSPII